MTGFSGQREAHAPRPERPAGGIGYPRTLGLIVKGKNIHEETLLATDYLNHFNEIVMLMELVADMPECLEDARDWQPKTYAQHFMDSGFQNKELAIFAYENAPQRYRLPFDHIVEQMNQAVMAGLAAIEAAAVAGEETRIGRLANAVTAQLRQFIDLAGAIINGHSLTSEQAEIDALLAAETPDELSALLEKH